jgi:hypothetical protein
LAPRSEIGSIDDIVNFLTDATGGLCVAHADWMKLAQKSAQRCERNAGKSGFRRQGACPTSERDSESSQKSEG